MVLRGFCASPTVTPISSVPVVCERVALVFRVLIHTKVGKHGVYERAPEAVEFTSRTGVNVRGESTRVLPVSETSRRAGPYTNSEKER